MLSTPPAFILSQDQTLMLKSWSVQDNLWLSIPVITVFGSLISQRTLYLLILNLLIWIFKDLWLFSFQSSAPPPQRQLLYIITTVFVCQELFSFLFSGRFRCFSTAFIVYQNFRFLSRTFFFFFILSLPSPAHSWIGRNLKFCHLLPFSKRQLV